MNILKRINDVTTDFAVELMTVAKNDKKGRKTAFGVGLLAGMFINCGAVAFADDDIETFGSSIVSIISRVYTQAFTVITALAAVCLVIAFIMRLTANQQKAAQATAWITRILISYIGVNIIGLIFHVIENTTADFKYDETATS
jgi:hypothetical protein